MNLVEILQLAGLNDKESAVYLALLELGEASVIRVGRQAGIERTYCYDILESLVRKERATVLTRNGRQRYQAISPDRLQIDLEAKLTQVKKAMPELIAHYNTTGQKPHVYYYEGRDAVEGLYREMLESLQYDAIVSPTALYEALGSKRINRFAATVVKNQVKIRELVTAEQGVPDFASHYRKPLQEVRLFPPDVKLATDTLLYQNKVVSIAYAPLLHAVVTEGSEIVRTQKAFFEYMWQSTGTNGSNNVQRVEL